MKTPTTSLTILLFSFAALSTAWGQALPPQPLAKTDAVQPQSPQPIYHSSVDASDLILLSTGKSAVDKAAVKAREERDAECYRVVSEGDSLSKAGRIQDAIAAYSDALTINPTDSLAYEGLAKADMACGKLAEASQNFHKILVEGFGPRFGAGAGGNSYVWANYALVLLKTKHETDALQAYNQAAYIEDYEPSQYGGVVAHLDVMLPQIAVMPASPAQVQYTPEHLQALADTVLAHSSSDYKQERAYIQEAAKLYPDSAVIQYYLGEYLDHSYYIALDSPVKDKTALWAAYEEDKKARVAAYKKAAELGDDKTVAAAKERLAAL